jgi:hypothetical protein
MVIVPVLFTGTSEMCVVLVLFAILLLTALVQSIYVNTLVLVLFTRLLLAAQ